MQPKKITKNSAIDNKNYASISQAAAYLNVSIDTLRRWEKSGRINSTRLDGKNRYFARTDLEALKASRPLSSSEVATLLGVSTSTVRRLEHSGVLIPSRDVNGKRQYQSEAVYRYIQSSVGDSVQEVSSSNNLSKQFNEIVVEESLPSGASALTNAPIEKSADSKYIGKKYYKKILQLAPLLLIVAAGVALSLLFYKPTNLLGNGSHLRADLTVGQPYPISSLNVPRSVSVQGSQKVSTLSVSTSLLQGASKDTGLTVVNNNYSLQDAFSFGTYATAPITSDEIANQAVGSDQIANGAVSIANVSPQLLSLIESGQGPTTIDLTRIIDNEIGDSGFTGNGLRGGFSGNDLTLSINTGNTTNLINNSLEVRLSSGVATTTTSSGSGLESTSQGLQLIGGCGSGQVLEYNGSAWACNTIVASGGSGSINVESGGGTVVANASGINLSANDFVVSNNGGEAGISINYPSSGIAQINQNEAITGSWSITDSGFTIENSADNSKKAKFDLSAIGSNTTQTYDLPNASGTLITTGNLNDITSLGTITSGSWQGSEVGVQYGGTGASSFTDGGVLYGNGSSSLLASNAGTSGQLLLANSSGVPNFVTLSGDATLTPLGALTLNSSGVAAGSYGSGSEIPVVTVNSEGRVTSVSTASISTSSSPTGPAGGDLTGSYPDPTIADLQGNTLTIGSLSQGQIIEYNGSAFVNQTLGGDISLSSTGAVTIAPGAVTGSKIAAATVSNSNLVNSSLSVIAGAGLSGGGVVSLGGSQTLSVAYDSTANTAVEGNVTFTCPSSGTDLSGGGNTITEGSGGNCNSLSVVSNPSFTTSVTTPLLTNAGDLSISTTGTNNSLTLNSSGGIYLAGFNCSTYDNGGKLTTNSSGQLICDNDNGGAAGTITGSGTTDYIPVYSGTSSLDSSDLDENGSDLELTSGNNLSILGGDLNITGDLNASGSVTLSGFGTGVLQSNSSGQITSAAVALGTDTSGSYIANLGTLAGLNTSGNSGASSTPTLSVAYGSSANTAVEGDTTFTCPSSGTDLSGGGDTITEGSGGSCSSLSVVSNPSFTMSVTTPSVTNAGPLSIATTGGSDLTLNSSGHIILTGFNCTTYDNGGKLTTNSSGQLICDNDNGGAAGTITGSGTTDYIPVYSGSNSLDSSALEENGSAIQLTSGNDLDLLGGNLGVTGNLSASGSVTLSGFGTGVLQSNSSGQITSAAVALGTDTTGSYVSNLGILTGLNTSGNSGASSTPSLSVAYGSSANTAAEGNDQLTVTAGTGLTGGGTLTLGGGGTDTLSLDINDLSADIAVNNGDYIPIYDSSTSSIQKISRSNFLAGLTGALEYQGTWNASTNTPTLSNATGTTGYIYDVAVAGTQNLGSGSVTFGAGDFVIYNGTVWQDAPSSSAVTSVFNRTGAITAQSGDYDALQVTNTPAGNISATTVQGALNELDTDSLGFSATSGNLTGSISGTVGSGFTTNTLSVVSDPVFSGLITGQAGLTVTGAVTLSDLGAGLVQSSSSGVLSSGTINRDTSPYLTGTLSVGNGGSGDTNFTTNGVLYGNSTNNLEATTAGTAGQLLLGAAGSANAPAFETLSGDASVTDAGVLTLDGTGVSANVYGDGTHVGQFTVNSEGRITSASSVLITGAAPVGTASGDLTGSYPDPTIASLQSHPLTIGTTPSSGDLLLYNGSKFVNQSITGDVLINGSGDTTIQAGKVTSADLADTTVSANSYGSSTSVPTFTVNAEGQLTVAGGTTLANAGLVNSSITVNTSAGSNLSGGGTVSLGGTLSVSTIANPSFTGLITGSSNTTGLALTGTPATSSTSSLFQLASSAITTGNANGTYIGVNEPATGTGSASDFLDFENNGHVELKVSDTGLVSSSGGLAVAGNTVVNSGDVLQNVTANTSILTSGQLAVAQGGTGLNGAAASNGQLLIGNGTGYTLGTITNNGGLTVSNGSGTLGLAVNYGSTANTAAEGNDQLTVAAGTGLTGGGALTLGAGGTDTLNVAYGSSTGTAVQGGVQLTCPSGSGNLTGGGTVITLGSGGTCGAISTNPAVSFGTSVTTPLLTNAGALTVSTTGASNTLALSSGSGNISTSGNTINAATISGGTLSGGNVSGGTLTSSAVNGLSVSGGTISAPTISGAADFTGSIELSSLNGTAGSTAVCYNGSSVLSVCSANSNGVTLQQGYTAAAGPQIALNSTDGGLVVRDASTSIGGNLLAVQNNAGTTTYFGVTTSGITTSGTINGATLSGGSVSGGTLTSSAVNGLSVSGGAISGGTLSSSTLSSPTISGTVTGTGSPTITGFGTINGATLSGGTLSGGTYTSTTADGLGISSSTVTATGALTISTTGGSNALTLSSASGNISTSGNTINTATISGGTLSGGTVSSGTLTSTAVNSLGVSATGVTATGNLTLQSASGSALALSAGATGTLAVTSSDFNLTSAGVLTGLTSVDGATLSGGTLSGGTVSSGTLTSTAVDSLGVSATAVTGSGALTVSSTGVSNTLALSSGSGNISTGSNTINTATISGGTLSAGSVSGGSLTGGTYTSTTADGLGISASTVSATGALTVSSGGTSGLTLTSASGNITTTSTINSLTISSGALSGVTGITFNGSTSALNVASNGITNAGTIGGVAGLTFISGSLALGGGNISGVGTIGLSGAITGATSGNTINGLVINSGALSSVTGITFASGSLNLNNGNITSTGSIGGVTNIAVGTGASVSSGYPIDIRSSVGSGLHLSADANDDGAYFTAFGTNGFYLSGGSALNTSGTAWIDKDPGSGPGTGVAAIMNVYDGNYYFFSNSGLTNGNSYSPTQRFEISSSGTITLAGGQSQDITSSVVSGVASTLKFQPATSSSGSSGASLTLQGGSDSAGSSTGGAVAIQAGTGTTNGTISIGSANTASINIGASGIGTTVDGSLTVAQALTAQSTLGVTGLATLSGGASVTGGITVSSGGVNITGGLVTDTLQVGTSTTAGYLLTASSSGVATWQAPVVSKVYNGTTLESGNNIIWTKAVTISASPTDVYITSTGATGGTPLLPNNIYSIEVTYGTNSTTAYDNVFCDAQVLATTTEIGIDCLKGADTGIGGGATLAFVTTGTAYVTVVGD